MVRRVTRRKYYGRNQVVAGLNSVLLELDGLAKAADYAKLGGKRLMGKFDKLRQRTAELHDELAKLPVTPDEKAIAKHDKVVQRYKPSSEDNFDVCFHCGKKNEKGARTCVQCGRNMA